MVPEAHMASNPVIGILLSELPPTLLLLAPSLTISPLSINASCKTKKIKLRYWPEVLYPKCKNKLFKKN